MKGWSQVSISVDADELSLSTILQEVSSKYNVVFGYNDDIFSQIQTTLHLSQVSIDDFLSQLCGQYGLDFRLIGGTYAIYIDDEKKVEEAIRATVARKKQTTVTPIEQHKVITSTMSISGIVKSAKTGDKINFCGVAIAPNFSVVTNEMGFFSLKMPLSDSIKIQINHIGYLPFDSTLYVKDTTSVIIELNPLELIRRLNAIHPIKLQFFADLSDVANIIEYNPLSAREVPALETNDLINALTVLPGINYLKGTETGLSIRGGAPSDNLVLIDGIPIIETSHLMGNLSVLNAKYIQQAFVSRGGFGAEYGGRTSGIVDLTGKSGSNSEPVIDFTANQLHANVYVGMPINDKTSLSGSFLKSFVDIWSDFLERNFALEHKEFQRDNNDWTTSTTSQTKVNYTDANFKLSIRPNSQSELNFNVFASYDEQLRNYELPIAEKYYQNNQSQSHSNGYSFNYKSQKSSGWMNTLSIGFNALQSYSVNEYNKDQLIKDQPVKAFFDSDEIELQEFRMNYKSEYQGKMLTHQYGAGYTLNSVDYLYEDHELKVAGANNFNDSINSQSSSDMFNAYYQLKFNPLKWLSLRAGVRGLYDLDAGMFNFQPRYGIEIAPLQHLKLHYSGGRYLQSMYLAYRIDSYKNVSQVWYIPSGDGNLLDASHNIVGARFELGPFLLNAEAYSKLNDNKMYFIAHKTMVDGLSVAQYMPVKGQELNRGIDVFLQIKSRYFKQLVAYSFSESFEKTEGINEYSYYPSLDDQLHRLRVTEVLKFRGFTASVNGYYSSGLPFMTDSSNVSTFRFDQLQYNLQFDVSLVKHFHFQGFYADFGFTVLNLLNRKNEIAYKNIQIPEGNTAHDIKVKTFGTSFSPLFYVNLRYE